MVTAVVGANWGDEGKGKITDMLAEKADIIVRFQGGATSVRCVLRTYDQCHRKRCCTEHSGILQGVQRSSRPWSTGTEDPDLQQSTDGNVLPHSVRSV